MTAFKQIRDRLLYRLSHGRLIPGQCSCVYPADQGDFGSELKTKFGIFHAGTADVAYPEAVDAGVDERWQKRRHRLWCKECEAERDTFLTDQ